MAREGVERLVIENDSMLLAKILAALVRLFEATVPVKHIMSVLGLINWFAVPGKGSGSLWSRLLQWQQRIFRHIPCRLQIGGV